MIKYNQLGKVVYMKRLFVFNSKDECPSLLVVASKVCKIIFIVFASLSALISLIAGIQSSSNLGNGGYFLFYLIIGAASFFLLLFQGFLLEILLLSFSIITKNHYEELSDKGKIDDFNSTPPKFILIRKPLIATQYYYFNLLKPEFQDIRVRKAFNYAIDREAIVSKILNYQAHSIGDGGIIPPAAFSGYDSEKAKSHGYTFQPEKAKRLFAQAGYPNGKDFPIIHIKFNVGTLHSDVAKEIANQLKETLNIEVILDGVSFEEKIHDQIYANGDLFRSSWFAEYNSPESFLMTAYGRTVPKDSSLPSMTNHSRYQNEAFDALFEMAKSTPEIVERYKSFVEAESILMEDAPYIILWYEETIKIVYSKVRNLSLNEMNSYSFKNVYLKEWSKKEWETKEKR